MLQLPSPLPVLEKLDPEDRMFIHQDRPQWGVGLWVKEERTRRRMRFEDGEMRAFKKGFYHLLEPVDPERDDLDDVFEALADEHEQVMAEKAAATARKEKPPAMSFADQLRVFSSLYDGGFRGQTYTDAARTREKGKLCKRHVDEELAMAQELLSKKRLQAVLAAENHGAIVDDLCSILARTTLVKPSKGLRPLSAVEDAESHKSLALAVYRLLYGKKRFRKRFRSWLDALRGALGSEPSWALATVFPALVHPEEHLCVNRRTIELQAREVRPGTHISKKVNRRGYRRAKRVARKVNQQLTEAGMQPRDLLDVRRFVRDTLRPKGQKTLAELDGKQ